MQVILLEHVEHLGRRGQLVRVKPGYARNYLLPRRLALRATTGATRLVAQEARKFQETDRLARETAEQLAQRLGALELVIAVKADEDGKLYGSVGPQEVHAALAQQGVAVERKQIVLDPHLKQLGTYEVPVRLHADVHSAVKVSVVQEQGAKAGGAG
jgi:large subunit ribosomal protein L9